jgi:hypothetical protein
MFSRLSVGASGLSVLVAGAVATIGVLCAACRIPEPVHSKTETRTQSIHLSFRDISQEAGLHYSGPTYAAAAADYDCDGWPDLAVSNHGTVTLYRNLGNGTFGASTSTQFQREGDTHGVAWIDIDGDEWLELIVSIGAARGRGRASNWLFRNQAGMLHFDPSPPESLAYPEGRGRTVCPIYRGDSQVPDIVVMNAFQPDRPQRFLRKTHDGFSDIADEAGISGLAGDSLLVFVPYPGARPLALSYPAPPNTLRVLEVSDSDMWKDVTLSLGIDIPRPIGAATYGDIDGDGDADLILAVGGGWPDGARIENESQLAVRFTRVPTRTKTIRFSTSGRLDLDLLTEGSSIPSRILLGARRVPLPQSGWNGLPDDPILLATEDSVGDDPGTVLWSDGQRLVLQFRGDSNHQEVTGVIRSTSSIRLEGANNLRPAPASPTVFVLVYEDGRYVNRARELGLSDVGPATDILLADLDNDLDLDLFVANGSDPFENPPNRLYLNDGSGRFEIAELGSAIRGPTVGRSASALAFDYDCDGDLDIFSTNGNGPRPRNVGPHVLLRNDTTSQNRAALLNLADYRRGNESPVSAIIEVGAMRRFVSFVGPTQLFSTSVLPLHIGLGPEESALITWHFKEGTTQSNVIRPWTGVDRNEEE